MLLKTMVSEMSKNEKNLNAVIVNGDFIKHGLTLMTDPTLENQEADEKKSWAVMEKTFKTVMKEIIDQNPGIPVLPTFGNNDMVYHNNAPARLQKESMKFYSDMYDLWFGNQETKPNKNSFLIGGFYRHDLNNTKTSFLCMNTIYFMYLSKDTELQQDVAAKQILWLKNNLEQNQKLPQDEKREFILSMHVTPGNEYWGS